jgi:hypothetical protein
MSAASTHVASAGAETAVVSTGTETWVSTTVTVVGAFEQDAAKTRAINRKKRIRFSKPREEGA